MNLDPDLNLDTDLSTDLNAEHNTIIDIVDNDINDEQFIDQTSIPQNNPYSNMIQSPSTLDLNHLNQQLIEQMGQDGIAPDVNSSVIEICTRIHHLAILWTVYANRYKYIYGLAVIASVVISAAVAVVGYNNGNLVEAILNSAVATIISLSSIFKLSTNGSSYNGGAHQLIKIRRELANRLQEVSRTGNVNDELLLINLTQYQDQIDDLQFSMLSGSQLSFKLE